jgi:hypothetical protein
MKIGKIKIEKESYYNRNSVALTVANDSFVFCLLIVLNSKKEMSWQPDRHMIWNEKKHRYLSDKKTSENKSKFARFFGV